MKQYKIFKHSSGKIEAIKQGWSWPAFFFNFIWAIIKKQWLLGFGLIVLWVLFYFSLFIVVRFEANYAPPYIVGSAFSWAMSFVLGFKGNSLREGNLMLRSYEYIETIEAKNPKSAVAAYVKSLAG